MPRVRARLLAPRLPARTRCKAATRKEWLRSRWTSVTRRATWGLQDDKELVFDGYDTLKDTLIMSAELINAVRPIKINMLDMANKGYTTATDFADYLVKEKKLSFRESYSISAKLVNFAEKNKKKLSELSLEDVKKIYKDLDKNVLKIFNVRHSMNSKNSHGGTSSNNTKKMIKKYKKEIQ